MPATQRRPEDFRHRYGAWALITGGSDGLGLAFAEAAAVRGLHLVLLARRSGPLHQTAELLRVRYGVQVLPLAADLAETETHTDLLPAATEGLEVGLVVANAAYAHADAAASSWSPRPRACRDCRA